MLFLSPSERSLWMELASKVILDGKEPGSIEERVRRNLRPVFDLYVGTLLASRGDVGLGKRWIRAGALSETDGLFLNSYLLAFLERHRDRLEMPAVAFEDPRPYVHFTTVPSLKAARQAFARALSNSAESFSRPLRVMDIGTGDGEMLKSLLLRLREAGKVSGIEEIFLIDQSKAMVELAASSLSAAFPGAKVVTATHRIQDLSDRIEDRYDLAVASLAYHHMPWEQKVLHLGRLKEKVSQMVVFEIDADNDAPEQNTPELALSLSQSYGRMIDFVFAHDAPMEVANLCVDNFLMTELISFLIHPRGVRTDYHMTRLQWRRLFEETAGDRYFLLGDTTCYADEHFNLFMLHYGG